MPDNEALVIRFSNPTFTLSELKAIFSDLDWLGRYATDVVLNDYRDYEPSEVRTRPRLPSLTVSDIRSGSLILEILAEFAAPTGSGVAILAVLNRILKHGPEVVALPHRLRESWFAAAHDAELAKQKLRRLQRNAEIIEVTGPDFDDSGSDESVEIPVLIRESVEGSEPAS